MAASVIVPIDQRFAQLIQQFGLTKNSFAMSLGKTASVVQHLIDGRNKPGYDLLCRVFEIYPNVSRDWLLLGRGPMLVGGELPVKAAVAAAGAPLEPLDLSAIEVPPIRRSGPGVAGTRLQPADIAATLALAAAAQPARSSAPAAEMEDPISYFDAPSPEPVTPPQKPAAAKFADAPEPDVMRNEASNVPMAERPTPVKVPAPTVPPPDTFVAAPPTHPAAASLAPETYVAAALNAQYLQHQLALAELRNQHLLDQQQMLREMLAMARQAMV